MSNVFLCLSLMQALKSLSLTFFSPLPTTRSRPPATAPAPPAPPLLQEPKHSPTFYISVCDEGRPFPRPNLQYYIKNKHKNNNKHLLNTMSFYFGLKHICLWNRSPQLSPTHTLSTLLSLSTGRERRRKWGANKQCRKQYRTICHVYFISRLII